MSVKMDKEGLFSFTFGCSSSTITRKVIITPFMSLKRFTEDGEVLESFKGRVYSGKKLKSARGEYTLIYSGIGDRLLGDAVLLLGTVTPAEEILFAGVDRIWEICFFTSTRPYSSTYCERTFFLHALSCRR